MHWRIVSRSIFSLLQKKKKIEQFLAVNAMAGQEKKISREMMTRSNHGNADVEIVICRRGQWYPIGRMESCVHDVHMHAWIYHEFSLLYTPENNRIESHELNLPIVVLSRITSSHSYPHPTPPHTTHFCMPVSLYPQHECVCLYPTLFDRNWQHIKVMRLILLLSHKQQSKYVQICNLVSVSIIYQYTSRNTHITHTQID